MRVAHRHGFPFGIQCNLLVSNGCPSSGNLTNMACLKIGYPVIYAIPSHGLNLDFPYENCHK